MKRTPGTATLSSIDRKARRNMTTIVKRNAELRLLQEQGMSFYGIMINERLKDMKRADIDVRHVEAYMRLEHPTLDGLPSWQFTQEVRIAISCIDMGGIERAERCAQSFGLRKKETGT